MREALVSPPLGFDVKESYNTRMDPKNRPDPKLAFAQWSNFVHALHYELGVKVHFLTPDPALPDMVFACDPGLWIDDLFIPANFQVRQRQREVFHFLSWFKGKILGEVGFLPGEAHFEGGDAVFVEKYKTLILGYGEQRTNERGVLAVKALLEPRGIKVVPIRRVTEEFYHLNSVLTVYPTADLLVYFPTAFELDAGAILREALPKMEVSVFGQDDLYRDHPAFGYKRIYSYCLNSIERHRKVITCYNSPRLAALLEDRHLDILETESSELEKSGGSWRCSMLIHNETRRA